MPSPAELDPRAVALPPQSLFSAEVLDSASAPFALIRCTIPSENAPLATDPMRWTPISLEGVGTFYPKRGDLALIAKPVDGPPWIVAWSPVAGATPDVPA